MTELFTEISRLREEIHAWRLEMSLAVHTVSGRVSRLEWEDAQFMKSGVEWRKGLQGRFEELEKRIEVFESHKQRLAWLGWSLFAAAALGVLKIWQPTLTSFL